MHKILIVTLLLIFSAPLNIFAEIKDPLDPFDFSLSDYIDNKDDENKEPDQLIEEAEILFFDDRPLDARTKLLLALKKEPNNFLAHRLLAGYYMIHVGHFRLALKYIKRAHALFEDQKGSPPYKDYLTRTQHARILQIISQARLNLDDYQGALNVLDEYSSYGYYQDWYAGSRAWILMKLGDLAEAIKVARLGIIGGAEAGRTLNILGILLSMTGDRSGALQIFRQAIAYELSLGSLGQPATPYNNSGEVYREIFREDMAEKSWLRATSLKDGCEHVLPALNLVVLYIEQVKYEEAKKAIDNFESCVAQFPLKNGEEHRAFVHLARGRIALRTGHIDSAIEHLEKALDKRQWFGKIGSSQEDLQTGATISLAQALKAKNNLEKRKLHTGLLPWVDSLKTRAHNRLRIWWLKRRARQILIEDLSNLEDLYVRNTDSMIEYPSFGDVLADLPFSSLDKKITLEEDQREAAKHYYKAYLAENLLRHGKRKQALEYLNEALARLREKPDRALKLHLLMLKLSLYDVESATYKKLAEQAFKISRSALATYGHRLVVTALFDNAYVLKELRKSAIYPISTKGINYSVEYKFEDNKHILSFVSYVASIGNIRVSGDKLSDVINQLNSAVFQEKL